MPAFFGRPSAVARGAFAALLVSTIVALGATSVRPAAVAAAEPRVAQESAAAHESGSGEAEGEGGWAKTIAKAVNLGALVGPLVYFLKTPLAEYLRTRHETIRRDLTDAAAVKTAAEAQLAQVRARLSALPAELAALQRRGEQDLADERARLADATLREKQRIIDRTHREIDLQFRIARRQLLERAADLAMRLARTRLERDMTSEDQVRLIERYSAEVRA